MLFIFEGVDGAGKTSIAKAVSSNMGIPYYNCFEERFTEFARAGEKRGADESYADFVLLDLSIETKRNLILDRSYPSGWVYTQYWDKKWYPGCDARAADLWESAAEGNVLIFWVRCSAQMAAKRTTKEFTADDLSNIIELYEEYFITFNKLDVVTINNDEQFVNASWTRFFAERCSKIIKAYGG